MEIDVEDSENSEDKRNNESSRNSQVSSGNRERFEFAESVEVQPFEGVRRRIYNPIPLSFTLDLSESPEIPTELLPVICLMRIDDGGMYVKRPKSKYFRQIVPIEQRPE
jgi:hypothetical protein